MIENLARTLQEHRRPALRNELEVLDRTVQTLYSFPQDPALARVLDPGLRGSSGP